jgi:hypothetical protein
MTTTGPGSISGPPSLPGQNNPVGASPNAQVIKLPEPLRDMRSVLQISGTVSESNPDGTVKIDTPEGVIEIKVPPQARLPEGQAVEIEIQPGRPPQNARVDRIERESSAPGTGRPDTGRDVPSPEAEAPRTDKTPLDINLKTPEPIKPPPRYTPEQVQEKQALVAERVLPPDLVVRLEPITAEQALENITDPRIIIAVKAEAAAAIATEAVRLVSALPDIALNATSTSPNTTTSNTPTYIIQIAEAEALPDTNLKNIPDLLAQSVQISETDLSITLTDAARETPALLQNLVQSLRTENSLDFSGINSPALPTTASAQNILFNENANIVTTTYQLSPAQALTTIPIKAETFTASVGNQFNQALSFKLVSINAQPGTNTPNPVLPSSMPMLLSGEQAGMIKGTVVGTQNNLPILHFFTQVPGMAAPQDLFFILHTPANLAPGTDIILSPQTSGTISASMNAPSAAGVPLAFFTPESWPLMNEINQALLQASPLAARAFTAMIPSPTNPGQIPAAALFFLAAIRGGDMAQWLGDRATDILRRDARGNFLSRLSSESSNLNRMMADPVSSDWRGAQLPMYWDGQIYKLSLHYRHEFHDEKEGGKGQKQVRFVFDLALDHMGKVQLDGLFRSQKLDLVIRTQQALSASMQMKMRQAYYNALAPTEIKGELSFQNKPEQWVTIQAAPKEKFGTSA